MDAKKLAMIIGIGVLLPLFLGFFVDAVYTEPKYDNYCNGSIYSKPYIAPLANVTCSDFYSTTETQMCSNDKGMPVPKYDANNCQVFDKCDYCSRDFNNAQQLYNRNIFFILAPIGLIIVIMGIYLTVEYIGAGLMFGGLATMFYATVRYFSDMSKLLRALVLLVELLVIIYIGYKKIEDRKQSGKSGPEKKKRRK
jgi:hypothetical protein